LRCHESIFYEYSCASLSHVVIRVLSLIKGVLQKEQLEKQFAHQQQNSARSAYFLRTRRENNLSLSVSVHTGVQGHVPVVSRPSRTESKIVDAVKRLQGTSESVIRLEKLQAAAMRRRVHPAGSPLVFTAKPAGGRESKGDVWRRLQRNWRFIVQHSIKETSMDTYSTALRIYKSFCGSAGIVDIWLQNESEEFLLAQERGREGYVSKSV
jgi:hypothetical protein